MTTTLPAYRGDAAELHPRVRLTTQSLRDDEIRAIADTAFRDDNPTRFECVRHAALMFERAGYAIARSAETRPAATPRTITLGRLAIDGTRRTVHYDKREIVLKNREFALLEILARHPGRVFMRPQLLDMVWPHAYDGDERTVDVHVARIRQKLGETPQHPSLILTVRGAGYKLTPPTTMRLA